MTEQRRQLRFQIRADLLLGMTNAEVARKHGKSVEGIRYYRKMFDFPAEPRGKRFKIPETPQGIADKLEHAKRMRDRWGRCVTQMEAALKARGAT